MEMTIDEAIDLLDNLIGMVEDNHNSDYDTALKMAIKALKQEPILGKIRAEITEEKDCGKWILYKRPFTNKTYYCSLCHSSSLYDYNYCPNCGSYMKVEEQGENKDGSNSN